jgi:hypothetical protein
MLVVMFSVVAPTVYLAERQQLNEIDAIYMTLHHLVKRQFVKCHLANT